MSSPNHNTSKDAGPLRVGSVLVVAAWFGLVTGLTEGAARLAMQELDWLAWKRAFVGVTFEIIWIAALFLLVLFLLVGTGWLVLERLSRVKLRAAAVFSFAFLMCLDWILLPGRFTTYGSIVFALGLATVVMRLYRRHESKAEEFFGRSLAWVVAIAVLSFAGIEGGKWVYEAATVASRPAATSDAPNVVVIVLDALRADHLSGLGYPRETSPNMDRLMQEGVVFENAIATSSWTLPSHASMLTGRYPFDHGGTQDFNYEARHYTLGEALQERGYRTGAFSANRHFFTRRVGFSRGFDHFEDFYATVLDSLRRTVLGGEILLRIWRRFPETIPPEDAAEVSQQALRWVSKDSQRPFLVFLNYYGTHDPYKPPEPYASMFSDSPPGLKISPRDPRFGELGEENSPAPERIHRHVNGYDGAIRNIDDNFAHLLQELRRASPREILLLITSDHGETFGEHGLGGHKGSLYWETIRVPLILWRPGHVPAGQRIEHPVSIAALPATILEILEESKNTFPVKSLAPLWNGSKPASETEWPLAELSHYPISAMKGAPSFHGALVSLVSNQWHFIHHEKFGCELYDWKNDPREERNLAGTLEGEEMCRVFLEHLSQRRNLDRTGDQ